MTILSAMHFNYNINRENNRADQRNVKLRVIYVKFKEGEGTVKQVKTSHNYGN